MSYAGPSRSQPAGSTSSASSARRPGAPRPSRPALDDTHETDWRQVAVFGAGLALGIALGAGVAMLTAPQSGEETRADLSRFAARKRRAIGRRSNEAWLDLRAEIRGARKAIARRKAIRAAEQEAAEYG